MERSEAPRETSDVRARDAGFFAAALLAAVVLVSLGTAWYLRALGGAASAAAAGEPPPEPRLQADENSPDEVRALDRRWEDELGAYGWIDRKRGIVRLPIDRAIELYVQRRRGRR